jgi:NAD(P)-dependent dehydrogenase (short-subunit alcohol dehydrogenase family)
VALHLARTGANLVLADLDESKLDGAGDDVVDAGASDPLLVSGDQSDAAIVDETLSKAIRHYGGIDGIVANAGIGVTGELHELADDQWHRALQVNLTSAFLLTRAAMRALRTQGIGGSLVYVASKNAFGPGAGFGAYSVSKAGMVQLMRIAALEGGAHGIRANAVNPDAVFDNSGLWDGGLREERAAAHGIAPDELEDFYAGRNLLHRRVTTGDVASTVAYLLSDDSSRTTGAVIPVDGGVAGAFPR